MKTLTWILTSILLLASSSFAADYPGTTGLIGGIYDSDVGFSLMLGGVTPITGRLYAIGHIDPSRSGEIETDIAFFLIDKPEDKLYVALVAGPNADWENGTDEDAITYLVGAAGIIVGYKPIGVGCAYKFSVRDDDLYRDGWRAGAWLSFKFTTP